MTAPLLTAKSRQPATERATAAAGEGEGVSRTVIAGVSVTITAGQHPVVMGQYLAGLAGESREQCSAASAGAERQRR